MVTALEVIETHVAEQVPPPAHVEYVSPDLAKLWLTKNLKNRNPKPKKLASYVRDMQAGKWLITGESIKFDITGRLIDGQNRLFAIVEAGVTVPMYVVRGLSPEAQLVIDTGANRSAVEALGTAGWGRYSKDDLAIARTLLAWESGVFKHCMWSNSFGYTHSELKSFVDGLEALQDLTALVAPVKRIVRLPVGALGACAYKFAQLDVEATVDFFNRLRDMRTDGKGDPIATLIKRVGEDRARHRTMTAATAIYLLVRAWNAYRAGDRIEKFQLGSATSGWATIPAVV